METAASGDTNRVPAGPSVQWAMSRFWQPGHRKLHPTLPRESHLEPGKKWNTGFFSMGLTEEEDTSP
jgi:hypothetical protein